MENETFMGEGGRSPKRLGRKPPWRKPNPNPNPNLIPYYPNPNPLIRIP